jgi:hypothetical protein
MRLLRSRLTRQPRSLCEVRSPYADKVRKNNRNLKKEPPALSKSLRILRPLVMMWAYKRIRRVRCEKGKPAARRGRKALGPPRARWEVAGLSNSRSGGAAMLHP